MVCSFFVWKARGGMPAEGPQPVKSFERDGCRKRRGEGLIFACINQPFPHQEILSAMEDLAAADGAR
jgi:hypothetical protein